MDDVFIGYTENFHPHRAFLSDNLCHRGSQSAIDAVFLDGDDESGLACRLDDGIAVEGF